ncbi:MAG TPA: DUF932 domain-containing protein, partial [Rhodothermales bacterium]|nr:DUF932 domain-containing protein [Rhodothermales bacterium]
GLVAEGTFQAEVKVGDVVSLGMLFENSYDGSRKLGFSLFINRLACSNGMLAPQYFSRMRFKHDSAAIGWEDEVDRALSVLGHADASLDRFAQAARALDDMRLGSQELSHIRGEVLPRLPTTLWGKMMDQYLLNEELTGWGLLNAGTNVCWHNEKGTISDFGHNEYLTSGLVEHATQDLPASA